MIGTRPLRIPNKVLETGDDPRYREDMETIERLVNSLTAPAAGGASPPYDGIVDSSLTPNHALGIYETPFTAINDLCNNKKVTGPSIAVIDRQGKIYLETASVTFGPGSTLFTGVTIKFFLAQEINGLGCWDTNGFTCDLNGGALQLEDADITSRVNYDLTHAPFINAGALYMVRVRADEFIHHIGINTVNIINEIFIDCSTFCTFHQGDGYILYFGGRWDLSNITGFAHTSVNPSGPFSMIGTRITSSQPGNVQFASSAVASLRRFSFRGCEYVSPSEISSGVVNVTFNFATAAAFVDIDLTCGSRASGLVTLNIADTTISYLRVRGGPFLGFGMDPGSENTATIDIDCFINNPATIRGAQGAVKFESVNAGHTIIGLHGGRIDAAVRDSGATNVTIFIFQSVVQCKIDIGYFTNGIATGLTPYNFDVNSNNNMLDFAGASQCPNPGVNAGAGNVIRTS